MNGERLVVLGWSRAILMQLAHPLVAAGVSDHSAFRGGVADAAVRLHNTVSAMLALAFGDGERRAAAVSRILAIHRTVHGTLDVDAGPWRAGTPYSAEDPALLLWVHATLLDSNACMYQHVVRPLSARDLDAMCEESLPYLIDLGGDAASAPRTWPALQTYMTDMERSGTLVVTPAARALGDAVLTPRAAGWPVPLTGLQRRITIGLLPAFIRAAYGWPWDQQRERQLARTLTLLRSLRRVAPAAAARFRDARHLP